MKAVIVFYEYSFLTSQVHECSSLAKLINGCYPVTFLSIVLVEMDFE